MLRVDLARLEREGPLRIEGVVEAAGFFNEDSTFSFVGDPHVDLKIGVAGSGEVIVRGTVRGKLSRECRRCLTAVVQEFDAEVMMGMFRELRAKQIRAEAEGGDALSPELRQFIEEAKASGVTRCPIRDIEEKVEECPVDFKTVSPADAKAAVKLFMSREAKH